MAGTPVTTVGSLQIASDLKEVMLARTARM